MKTVRFDQRQLEKVMQQELKKLEKVMHTTLQAERVSQVNFQVSADQYAVCFGAKS